MKPIRARERLSIPPQEALARLLDGNRRFVEHRLETRRKHWQADLVRGQSPFAVILGCSDSRAPAELVFDQGLGDLFIVRVAGNYVAPSLVGSVEFAVAQFGVRLVLVMGHTRCGAIRASFEAAASTPGLSSKNIRAITRRIRPQIKALLPAPGATRFQESALRKAERANVLGSVRQLRQGSPFLRGLVARKQIRIAGSILELETGRVRLLKGS